MMEATAIGEVQRQREARLESLNDEAENARVKADALDALVTLISEARVPVARYEPHWRSVEERLRKDVALARRRVTLAQERVLDVQRSIEARENWTPKRGEVHGRPDAVGG